MNATRTEYPAGVPCWVDSSQPDVDAAIDFYGGLFGWDFDDRSPDDGSMRYLIATLRGLSVAGIGSARPGADVATWNTHIAVESADETSAKAADVGGKVIAEAMDVGDAGRLAWLADRAGAEFAVWQSGQNPGAALVNEPGSWNFNELNIRDRDQAIAFYGEVFGWETDAKGADGSDLTFWRRPGYGEFLDQLNPGTLERMEEFGAPKGFADAIGWLAPIPEDQPGTSPHWSTTFGVADADATAVRAKELGATVLLEPMDAPWVRMTVIRDPQGAVFTGSQFVPPE